MKTAARYAAQALLYAAFAAVVGYFSSRGTMDTCIAIRTGLVKGGKLYIQAGGGIVADSKERDEFLETENKAKALIKAAEKAKELYDKGISDEETD